MRKAKQSESSRMMRPALTPEARENQLVSLAVDLAEKQLREGTASSQVITHYLKLGSTKERIEKEILEKQKELIEAKTQNLKSIENSEKLYADALKAFRGYSGHGDLRHRFLREKVPRQSMRMVLCHTTLATYNL